MIHFLLANGIGQNITASFLLGIPTLLLSRKWIHRRLENLHSRFDSLENRYKKGHKNEPH